MKKQPIKYRCFEINRTPYHLKLIPKFSRRWKDTGSSLRSLLMAIDGTYSYLKKKGQG